LKNICFTGHRKIADASFEKVRKQLEKTIQQLITDGAENFYCGGALGWDTLCALTVLNIKNINSPHIRLNLVLPCSNAEQTMKWSAADKIIFYEIINKVDNTEYISQIYTNDCMRRRNARLVEHGECCVCYYDGKTTRSGTAQTVRMANAKGIPIINIYELI